MERAPLERASRPSSLTGVPTGVRGVLAYRVSSVFWLDLYLSGSREEEFAPPAPFAQGVLDSVEALPERPYTKEELHAYLASTRQKCHIRLLRLPDEQARQAVEYPWAEGQAVSFLELQLYNMRHVQEHAAQLSLFLGQHAIPGEALDWVQRAKDEPGSTPPARLREDEKRA